MMQNSKSQVKEMLDYEELLRRKFRARCRFRSLGRMVIANLYWLIDGVDFYEGVDDVRRRVEQAVRARAPAAKQLLSIDEKTIMNKPAEERTDSENHHLYRIIGGLKCFKRYPNYVKRRLAAVTYFKYYGPGRTIVRQHQEAHALYFIVSGDIIISQMIYDELLKKYQSVDLGVMRQGDMFGEVSLLHNIPRTATCTSGTHCELLALMKDDFKKILQQSVQKQWDEVQKAMSSFNYFDGLDEVARREGCIVAKMKSFSVNEHILGDGVGVPNFVYFVLSGRCQMIESMQVRVQNSCGREIYTLHDPFVEAHDNEQDLDSKYFFNKQMETISDNYNDRRGSSIPSEARRKTDQNKDSSSKIRFNQESQQASKSSDNKQDGAQKDRTASTLTRNTSDLKSTQLLFTRGTLAAELSGYQLLSPQLSSDLASVRTFFMQVCLFNPGSSFGFGESMRDRRIIALTPVDCMLMPKMWLLQRNTANIWTRVQHYLEKKIPTKKQLFKEWVSDRRWRQYRDQVVQDVVSRATTINYTTIHDVPYSMRMEAFSTDL